MDAICSIDMRDAGHSCPGDISPSLTGVSSLEKAELQQPLEQRCLPAPHLPSPQICEKQHPPHTSPAHCSSCLTLCLYSVSQSSLGIPLLPLRFCRRSSSDPTHTVLSIMQSLLPPWLLYILNFPEDFKALECCPPLSSTGVGK